MDKIMAVVTKEIKFAEKFCSYINRKNILKLPAVPFDNMKKCAEYSKKHRIEILVCDNSESKEDLNEGYIADIDSVKLIYLISGEDGEDNGGAGDIYGMDTALRVPKYQSAEGIVRSIIEYAEDIGVVRPVSPTSRRMNVISIYSPVNGCGKTAFAVALSKCLSRKGKVLYLNLEEFSIVYELAGGSRAEGISEAVYLMKQGILDRARIELLKETISGIDWLKPVNNPADIGAISGEEYAKLINEITENSDYSYIVADMNRFTGQADAVMGLSKIVYMPSDSGRFSIRKREAFIEYLKNEKGEEWAQRVVPIDLPATDSIEPNGGYVEAVMFSEIGDFAARLMSG